MRSASDHRQARAATRLGALLAMAALCAATPAQARAVFDRDLERVHHDMDRGRWLHAKRGLLALIGAHARSPHARARAGELVEDFTRCSFALQNPPPEAGALIDGELLSHRKRSGTIKLRYTPDTLGDFIAHDGEGGRLFTHPAEFRGAHKITLRGSGAMRDGGPRLFVCARGKRAVDIALGARAGGARDYYARTARLVDDSRIEVLAAPATPPVDGDDEFEITVQVGSRTISVERDGQRVMQFRNPARDFGRFSFAAQAFDELVLEGVVHSAWLRGKQDTWAAEARARFEEDFDPRDELPAWLLEAESESPARTAADVTAARGPAWSRRFEHRSAHYRVSSDLDHATCVRVSRTLEQALAAFEGQLGRRPRGGDPLDVYVFSGQAGYAAYCGSILGETPAHTAGLYSPQRRQLLVWNLPSHDAMTETLRHEALHQYLHEVAPEAPLWLHEGLAMAFERAGATGRLRGNEVRPDLLASLGGGDQLIPLAAFTTADRQTFYGDPERHYAQAWALVHFLRSGDRRIRPRFKALLDALRRGDSGSDAIARAFAGLHLDALDEALGRHVRGIAAPATPARAR